MASLSLRRSLISAGLFGLLLIQCGASSPESISSRGFAARQTTSETPDLRQSRLRMVREQIEARGVSDPRVLDAMRKIPRHLFVPPAVQSHSYADTPLPIGHGQTISQPYIVAFMSEALELKGDERVLEIGTGSGYQAAVLANLAREVYSIEIVEPLAKEAEERLDDIGHTNVQLRVGDG